MPVARRLAPKRGRSPLISLQGARVVVDRQVEVEDRQAHFEVIHVEALRGGEGAAAWRAEQKGGKGDVLM